MKKKVLLLLVMAVFILSAEAKSPVDLGVRAGWTISSTDLKKNGVKYSFDNAGGFLLGAYVGVDLSEKLYLEPSLNFSLLKSPDLPADMDMPKLKQIQIPVVIGYYIINSRIFGLRGFLGPEVDFTTNDVEITTLSDKLDLKNTTWHGKLGFGVDLWRFNFNIDYKFGLMRPASHMTVPKGFNLTVGFDIF